jgi:ATP adenylyltransferase
MFLVPRSTECFKGISVNALGFAGGLLVKDEVQLNLLKTFGPMTVLQRVAICEENIPII